MSWYGLPGTLVTFPCCSQSWCGWHGLVLELEEEKKPRGQARHWVFSKGVPAHGEARGPSARGDELARARSWGRCRQSRERQAPFEEEFWKRPLPAAPLGSIHLWGKQQRFPASFPPPKHSTPLTNCHRPPGTRGDLRRAPPAPGRRHQLGRWASWEPNQPFDSQRSQEAPGQAKVKVAEKVKARLASAAPQFPTQAPGQTGRCFAGTVPHERGCTRVARTFLGRRGNGPNGRKCHPPFRLPFMDRVKNKAPTLLHPTLGHRFSFTRRSPTPAQLMPPAPEPLLANGKNHKKPSVASGTARGSKHPSKPKASEVWPQPRRRRVRIAPRQTPPQGSAHPRWTLGPCCGVQMAGAPSLPAREGVCK